MGSKLLDMRQWGLAALDEDMAHLRHKDGHEMQVSIKHLPKLQQEQIKRIKKADGGPVIDPKDAANIAKSMGMPQPKPPEPQPKPQGYKKGGEVDGLNQEELDYARELGDERTYDKNNDTGMFTPSQGEPNPVLKGEQPAAPAAAAPNITIHNHAAPAAAPAPSVGQQVSDAQNTPAPAAPDQPFSPEQAQQGQVQASQEVLGGQQELQKKIQSNLSDMQKHTDEFAMHMQQNPINPRSYQESQSSGQKTNTAIGLILGGFGGMGKGNAALDFLNRQIDRDIDAQKANMEREKNIYGAYQHLYENEVTATNLTKASLLDIYDSKMRLSALKIGTPQAMNNYQAFNKEVQVQKGQLLQQAAVAKEQGPQEVAPILKPGANISAAQFNPVAKANYETIKQQFTAAQQADKALANLGPTFDRLTKNRSVLGRVEQQSQLNLPFGTGELLHGPAKFLANTEPEFKEYQSAKTALLSDLTNALRGTNVAGSDIQEIVDRNTPVYGDSPEQIKQKRDTIEGFIRRSVPTSMLGNVGLLNKP